MKTDSLSGLIRKWIAVCAVLGALFLTASEASAQHYRHEDRYHRRPVVVQRRVAPAIHHRRHRVVQYVRVRRNGHWVRVRRVVWR